MEKENQSNAAQMIQNLINDVYQEDETDILAKFKYLSWEDFTTGPNDYATILGEVFLMGVRGARRIEVTDVEGWAFKMFFLMCFGINQDQVENVIFNDASKSTIHFSPKSREGITGAGLEKDGDFLIQNIQADSGNRTLFFADMKGNPFMQMDLEFYTEEKTDRPCMDMILNWNHGERQENWVYAILSWLLFTGHINHADIS